MTTPGSSDTPPAPDGSAAPVARPEPADAAPAVSGPVLSLADHKAEAARLKAAPAPRVAPVPAPDHDKIVAAPKPAPAAAGGAPAPKPAQPRPAGKEGPAQPRPAAPRPPGPQGRPPPQPQALPRPAKPAKARGRHLLVLLSFLLLVVAPTVVAAWYLWERAAPRYASYVGFSVRTEEVGTALDFLGGMASIAGGSSSKDTDILYRFIQSQEIVAAVDAELDLRTLWAKGDPERDPVFAYDPPGTIEDLHGHWLRMVAVYNDTSTGLLDIQVQAFTPEDAQALAQAIYAESQTLINRLSDIAQEDRTRHAREELESAEQRLTEARLEMTRFRNETQIVDPVTALQGQMGLLGALEEQLAQTQIELDLLRESAGDEDPRIDPLVSRVAAIEARMEEERQKLGLGTAAGAAGGGTAFADLVGEFERLAVEQEFAQQAYVASLAAYDQALAEGRQQSRYLAAHVAPTLAERAEYPNRWALTLLTALFAFLAWMLLTLTGYALRDRR